MKKTRLTLLLAVLFLCTGCAKQDAAPYDAGFSDGYAAARTEIEQIARDALQAELDDAAFEGIIAAQVERCLLRVRTPAPMPVATPTPDVLPTIEPLPSETPTPVEKAGHVNAKRLNLRAAPNYEGAILGEYKKYDALVILGEQGEWRHVRINGVEGYMAREYVSVGQAPVQDVPTVRTVQATDKPMEEAQTQRSYTVYITKTGSKYHRSGCRYLSKSKISIDYRDAVAQGYGACSVCNP